MGKGGRMPQRKGAGASRRRDKHRRSGFSDGSGSDSSAEVAVKYQRIGEQCEGSSSDDNVGGSSAEVGASDQRLHTVDDEVVVRSRMVNQRQRLVTATRAVEALRWAVSVARNGELREAVRTWGQRCRSHGIARMTTELRQGYSSQLQQRDQCIHQLEAQLMQLTGRCEEMGSEVERVSKGGWLRAKEEV